MTHAQTQKGIDIGGEAADDRSGYCVSMPDYNTMAIGAYRNDGNGDNAGHVRVYSWNEIAWVQKGTDIEGETAFDASGWSVSMPDSNTVAIGANFNDGSGTNSGHVRVYSWKGSTWVQKGIDIDGEAAEDQSGSSISMPDSNTVAIGAQSNDGNGTNSGHVRVYSWDGTTWVQKGNDIDGEAADDRSGSSISMPNSNTIAIGALYNDGNGTNSGHVRVYSWDGSTWVQKGNDIDGEAANDMSGWSVSMPDSNTVAIGALYNDGNGANSGHVRVYSWKGSSWIQKGIDIDGEAANDWSGSSVSMPNSNTVAIGARLNDGTGTNAGHVRVYSWKGSSWMQKGIDIDGEAAEDQSGYSLSMPDSNTVAIGAFLNDRTGIDAGLVGVYCFGSTNTIFPTACDSYVSPSARYRWTSSGTYLDTIPNKAGCDSIIIVYLTINTVDILVINNSPTLSANATGAVYNWLDCNNNFTPISGETNQTYTATSNGSYAVEITQNGCIDTSACQTVNTVGIFYNEFGNGLIIFPNPTSGQLQLNLGNTYNELQVIIRNELGQQVSRRTYNSKAILNMEIIGASGIYLIEIIADHKRAVVKVIKE